MKTFASLISSLEDTSKTNLKVELLHEFFKTASDNDKLWLLALFSGRKIKRSLNSTKMKEWACEKANLSIWMFEECYRVVGDLSETIALILPPATDLDSLSLSECISMIQSMDKKDDDEKKEILFSAWNKLDGYERLVFNKLITGGFRIGVSQKLVNRALSLYTGIEENIIAHRMMGNWTAENISYVDLISRGENDNDSRPYPFYLAYPLETEISSLGNPDEFQAEWKWDGIRGQIIFRNGELYVWSRGEELLTDRFPEFHQLKNILPEGIVIDGEILSYKDGNPLPFAQLQTRINRKTAGKKLLAETPISFMAYDLLEYNGKDYRNESMSERRKFLEEIVSLLPDNNVLILSPLVKFASWDELKERREESRNNLSEGLMLKRKNSIYEVGRKRGNWWKWKVDPFTIDAVMIYAQAGHGRRANLYTDYTFALWDKDQLIPFAKAYSGLTDKEIQLVDAFVKRNTKEKFGPVRSVKPELVFELAFEGINISSRHKSGVAVRFPRIHRWRTDKRPEEANTLDDLKALIKR